MAWLVFFFSIYLWICKITCTSWRPNLGLEFSLKTFTFIRMVLYCAACSLCIFGSINIFWRYGSLGEIDPVKSPDLIQNSASWTRLLRYMCDAEMQTDRQTKHSLTQQNVPNKTFTNPLLTAHCYSNSHGNKPTNKFNSSNDTRARAAQDAPTLRPSIRRPVRTGHSSAVHLTWPSMLSRPDSHTLQPCPANTPSFSQTNPVLTYPTAHTSSLIHLFLHLYYSDSALYNPA